MGGNSICQIPRANPEFAWKDSGIEQNIPAMSIGASAEIRTENVSYTSQKLYCLSYIARCKRYKNCGITQILSTLTTSKQRVLHGVINQLTGADLLRSLQSLRYSRNSPLSLMSVFTKTLQRILSEPKYFDSHPPSLLLQGPF